MADRNAAVRKYLTEMIGTFVFMFAVLGIVLSGSDCVAATAVGIGSVLMVMVYASGHISGGHLNPAVSVAAYLRGALPLGDLGPYIVAQLVGALAAFSVGFGLWHDKYSPGALDLTGNVWAALLAEAVFTFTLCYVVLHTATSKDSAGNSFYGLAIGFVVTVGVVAVGSISGAAFNPAITFGLMLSGVFSWKFLWVYLFAQLLGAAVAAYAYKATTLDEYTAAARRG
ncbi:porin [Mycolicibacter nonchromogenicus]|uniref:Porin n=1 Tax=Mycolicibacter nonchromogenicus TaxID=1782 RepID=A0A1X1ZPG5_MYCNO|nr:aquaporin [Mycolicibacter nonchromogenicus]OBI07926.1 porin [Mycolicibacter heraklionensis]ORW25227.1 porin [Mycolicibacter nonchromogenicus]